MFRVLLERRYLRGRVRDLEDQLLVLAAARDESEAELVAELEALGERYRIAREDRERVERVLCDLEEAVAHLLALKGGKGSGAARRVLAEMVGADL